MAYTGLTGKNVDVIAQEEEEDVGEEEDEIIKDVGENIIKRLMQGPVGDALTAHSTFRRQALSIQKRIDGLAARFKELCKETDAVHGVLVVVDKHNNKVTTAASHTVMDICTLVEMYANDYWWCDA